MEENAKPWTEMVSSIGTQEGKDNHHDINKKRDTVTVLLVMDGDRYGKYLDDNDIYRAHTAFVCL